MDDYCPGRNGQRSRFVLEETEKRVLLVVIELVEVDDVDAPRGTPRGAAPPSGDRVRGHLPEPTADSIRATDSHAHYYQANREA